VIFEELRHRNSELVLDRKLADRRTYRHHINKSATRREELLLDDTTLNRMYVLRKVLSPLNRGLDGVPVEKVKATDSNAEFSTR